MTVNNLTSDEARAELYEIMRADTSFESKADRALVLGEDYLDVENAHLTRIDARIDFWESIASTDPTDGEFPAGEVLDLQTTYCRRVIDQGSSIALSDASEQGWSDDAAFKEHGLHCYHGTPLTIDDEVWGTLCFVSEAPREEPFSNDETLFAELIARLLESELRTSRQQSEISLQSNLISVLSRVLRHNLRNDLNVIRGQLTRLAEKDEDGLLGDDTAVNKIDKLVDLANTARKIESLASSDLERKPVELRALLENLIQHVTRNYPDASFTLDCPEDVYLEAVPSLGTGFEELLENAAKHSGDDAQVTVSIDGTGEAVVIEIIDNGPGLPEQERDVLRKGSESPLIHGSGLGLWLSYWIIASHDGSIDTDVRDAGTHISVTLPRTTSVSDFADAESLLGQFHHEQDKFEAIFESSFDAIVLIDDEGHYTDVNESAAELFGLSQNELRGRSVSEFVPCDFDFNSAWAELIANGRERSTFTLVRPDGSERIVEYSAVTDIVPDQHLAILRDVSERIEDERTLQETKGRLEAIIDASPDPIFVLDGQGVIELWNDAAEAVFGYEADEVVGEPLHTIGLHGKLEIDTFVDPWARLMAGERFDDLVVSRETKDGDEIQVSLSTSPIYDSDGDMSGVVAVAQDITESLERERMFDALVEGFPDLGFVIDEDGVYREVLTSPKMENHLIGNPEGLVGRSMDEMLPRKQCQLLKDSIDRTIETGELQTDWFELDVPAGSRVFEARTHRLAESNGEKRLVSMIVRDITEFPSGEEVVTAT